MFQEEAADEVKRKKKLDGFPTNAYQTVLTYDGFLFSTLFSMKKGYLDIRARIMASLIRQFNRKAGLIKFIEEIELIIQEDE